MSNTQTWASLLSQIPSEVWAALMASAITLLGVMVSNYGNTKRLEKQLKHASAEKSKDRFNALRKEVYLSAVEEMAKIGNFFGKIPTIDPVETNIADGISELLSALAKLQLIADTATASLASELSTRCAEILMDLTQKALPLFNANAEIQILGKYYDLNITETQRILAEMTRLNESGNIDPTKFLALQKSVTQSHERAKAFSNQKQAAFERRQGLLHEYTKALMIEMRSIGVLQVNLMAAARRELDLNTDISGYEARLQSNWKRVEQKLEDQIAAVTESPHRAEEVQRIPPI